MTASGRQSPPTVDAASEQPAWVGLAAAEAVFGALFALGESPRSALFWYIFPLFGLGGVYVIQFRSEFARPWKLTFAASAVVSAVALGLDWPFSGHVLWNVLLLGHAKLFGKHRTPWLAVMCLSLLHLLVLKVAFQTRRDIFGAGIAITVALIGLLLLRHRQRRDSQLPHSLR